jgi:parvulin-like peptidyl-prolyl isomerase
MNWFRRHRKTIILSVVGVFIVGTFASFGSYFFDQSPFDAAILVNNRKIPFKRFEILYGQVLEDQRQRSPTPLTDPQREYLKRQVIQGLVQEEVFVNEAENLGIQVTDTELAQLIQTVPAFQREGRFDPRVYQETVARLRLRVEDFESEQRRQLMAQKVQFVMASGVKISSLEFPSKLRTALSQATEENKKKIAENPNQFREDLRRQEIQACLQEWYTDASTRLKVKVLLNKLEPTAKTDSPPPSTPTIP